jgi:FAD/FMN-containing dehydrogenase
MIDRRPALIARCAGAADVIAALAFAREHGLAVSVRGGGHSVAGMAACKGGLMLDLSPMKAVRVDPAARTARAEPGMLWGEFDREAHAFGLATPGGVVATTGVAGLTLGGGQGWLTGKHGPTLDNLLAADVVTADGTLLRASAEEHADLFWVLRGAGVNWTRACFDAARPHLTHGVDVNDLGDEGGQRVRDAYGGNYARLVEVKTKYDPANVFRHNQNVEPAT